MDNSMDQLLEYKEITHSPKGIAAFVVGIVSLIVFIALSFMSMMQGGQISLSAGAVGLSAFIAAFVGMVEGLLSFNELCTYYTFSKAGTLLCGALVAVWFLIICVGLS